MAQSWGVSLTVLIGGIICAILFNYKYFLSGFKKIVVNFYLLFLKLVIK